jgi:hypothetical protein
MISSLITTTWEVLDQLGLQTHIYQFYRDLMGAKGEACVVRYTRCWPLGRQISSEQNSSLAVTFTAAELDEVLAGMRPDSGPGPDGLPVTLFKNFWGVLREPILNLLNNFALGRAAISRINFGVLTLIPKVPEADTIKQFRPIALINVIFKFVSKVYTIRFSPIAHRTIDRAGRPSSRAEASMRGFWLCTILSTK